MKLRDILGLLEREYIIALRNEDNSSAVCPEHRNLICITMSNSEGVDPYLDRELKSWGLTDKINTNAMADLFFVLAQRKAEPETIDIGALAEEIVNSSLQQEE